jgi:hypothetical protein
MIALVLAFIISVSFISESLCFKSPLSSLRLKSDRLLMATGDVKAEKRPWEFFRFLKTASFYGAFKPKLPFFPEAPPKESVSVKPNDFVYSTSDYRDVEWGPLDDVVMGGASKTDLLPGEKFNGIWSGSITTANNGGFAGYVASLSNVLTKLIVILLKFPNLDASLLKYLTSTF